MKQYTNESQTAKLIELGFREPKSKVGGKVIYEPDADLEIEWEEAYSIGELIEMLSGVSELEITRYGSGWEVGDDFRFCTNEELIDALYDMIIMIKEEGVI